MNLAHVCRARTLEGRGGGGSYARFITLEHIRRGISDLETSSSSLLSFFSFFRGGGKRLSADLFRWLRRNPPLKKS